MIKTTISKDENGVIYVTLEGNLDTPSSNEFSTAIQPLFNESEPNIIINCEGLTYISSSGLRTFMLLQKSVNKNNGQLVLERLLPEVKRVFDMTGFSKIIVIRD